MACSTYRCCVFVYRIYFFVICMSWLPKTNSCVLILCGPKPDKSIISPVWILNQ